MFIKTITKKLEEKGKEISTKKALLVKQLKNSKLNGRTSYELRLLWVRFVGHSHTEQSRRLLRDGLNNR